VLTYVHSLLIKVATTSTSILSEEFQMTIFMLSGDHFQWKSQDYLQQLIFYLEDSFQWITFYLWWYYSLVIFKL
jgi:hypothetical protein